jgi:uncharacterized protein YciI
MSKRSLAGGLWAICCLLTPASAPFAQTPPASAAQQVYAVIFARGSGWTSDAAAIAHPALKEHVGHFQSLGERLIAAAPFVFVEGEPTVGMVVLLAESDAAARTWAAGDPAVKAQVMTNKVLRWRVTNIREFKLGR